MRMWKAPVHLMCRQHLLAEHVEMHMFASCIKEKRKLTGYINNGKLEPYHVKDRHDIIAIEMNRRGYNHKTPLEQFEIKGYSEGKIDISASLKTLKERCVFCDARQNEIKNLLGVK